MIRLRRAIARRLALAVALVTGMTFASADLRLILGAALFAIVASTVPVLVVLIGAQVEAAQGAEATPEVAAAGARAAGPQAAADAAAADDAGVSRPPTARRSPPR